MQPENVAENNTERLVVGDVDRVEDAADDTLGGLGSGRVVVENVDFPAGLALAEGRRRGQTDAAGYKGG